MLKFHNKVCDHACGGRDAAGEIFTEARRTVTWHYQWMVLHDLVERITEKGIVAKILDQGRRFYRFKKTPYMPVEFSAAAYRLGHSMVREVYSHNRIFTPGGGFRRRSICCSGSPVCPAALSATSRPNPLPPPLPLPVLPSNWIIDWRRYHEVLATNPPGVPLNSLAQDRSVPHTALHTLPGGGGSLPFRNLKRGVCWDCRRDRMSPRR